MIAQCLWLSLPVVLAGILHMVFVKKDWLAFLKKPVDFGAKIGRERVFGDNKTWRGFVVMVGLSAALGFLQGFAGGAWAQRESLSCIADVTHGRLAWLPLSGHVGPLVWSADPTTATDYAVGYAVVSAVLGLGYALGELPNSFLKRRVKIHPGKTGNGALGAFFFILDQADSVVAALGLGALAFRYPLEIFVVGSLLLTGVHLFLNASLYLLRVRKNL